MVLHSLLSIPDQSIPRLTEGVELAVTKNLESLASSPFCLQFAYIAFNTRCQKASSRETTFKIDLDIREAKKNGTFSLRLRVFLDRELLTTNSIEGYHLQIKRGGNGSVNGNLNPCKATNL